MFNKFSKNEYQLLLAVSLLEVKFLQLLRYFFFGEKIEIKFCLFFILIVNCVIVIFSGLWHDQLDFE